MASVLQVTDECVRRTRPPAIPAAGSEPTPTRSPVPRCRGTGRGSPGLAAMCPLTSALLVWFVPRLLQVSVLSSGKWGQITPSLAELPRQQRVSVPPRRGSVHTCLHTRTHTCRARCPSAHARVLGVGPAGRPHPGLRRCQSGSQNNLSRWNHTALYLWARLSWIRAINPGAASAKWALLPEDQKCPGRG